MNTAEYHIILCTSEKDARTSWLRFSNSLTRFSNIWKKYFTSISHYGQDELLISCIKYYDPEPCVYVGTMYVVVTTNDETYMFIDKRGLTTVPIEINHGMNVKVHSMHKFLRYLMEFEKEIK